jgi:hypothetical protein
MAVDYESQIAAPLRRELGGGRKAAKTLMRWTGASERTSKKWLSNGVGSIRRSPELDAGIAGAGGRRRPY